MTRSIFAALGAACAWLALSAPAFAAPGCSTTITRTLTAPSTGWVTARGEARRTLSSWRLR